MILYITMFLRGSKNRLHLPAYIPVLKIFSIIDLFYLFIDFICIPQASYYNLDFSYLNINSVPKINLCFSRLMSTVFLTSDLKKFNWRAITATTRFFTISKDIISNRFGMVIMPFTTEIWTCLALSIISTKCRYFFFYRDTR